ncbi:hypothetical protein Scep_027540 [Stephania cephalantha]|uniref:Uncharacterized protein n=1 Tax=Stephania cephalantha TaxID=152367 RepID=A0AAP0EBE4_9MAGN
MAVEGALLDDKEKRKRDLLSSFYSHVHSSQMFANAFAFARFALLGAINMASFDAGQYMNLLVQFEAIVKGSIGQKVSFSRLWFGSIFLFR